MLARQEKALALLALSAAETQAKLVQREAQSRLAETTGRFQLLVEGVKDYALFTKDLSGYVTSWNRGAERLLGYAESEILGKHFSYFFTPDAAQAGAPAKELSKAFRDRQSEEEGWRVKANGERFWASVSRTILVEDDGRAYGFAVIMHDLTAKKTAEREINEKAIRIKAVVESAVDGLITIDEAGIIESFNPACERIFGYTTLEVIGQNIKMLMPEPYCGEHDGYLANYIATGEAHIIGSAGREVSGKRKDGSVFSMDLSISAFQLEDGRHFSGIIRDITERKQTMTALRLSEERYELAMKALSVGIWDWDVTTDKLDWSPLYKELMGIHHEEFVPHIKELASRLHPEDKERMLDMLHQHLRNEGPYDIEYRFRRRDGNYVWIRAKGQATWGEDGTPLRMVGSIDEITERKRAEAKLHAVLHHAVDGLITIDERGTVESFNPACEGIFGYRAAEVIGRNIKMLMPEPYHSEHDGYLAHFTVTGKARIIGTAGREVSGKRKDGSVFPMDLAVSAFQLENGRCFSGIIRDISEQKKNALALAEASKRFRLLVEGVKAHALFTIDLNGCVASWNRGAERLLGYTEAEIVGRSFSCMFTQEDIERGVPETQMNKAREAGQAEDEGWRIRANGERFWANVNKTALLEEGDCAIRGFAVIVQDVTERKKIATALEEARLEKLRLQEGFLSHVSHELRTPLTAIYFFTTNVLDGLFGDLTPEQRDQLNLTLENANQLKNMVSDLLDITRIETHKLTVTSQPTNLTRLITEVLNTCQTNAVGRDIRLSAEFAKDMPFAWADPSRVRQILTNLIDNGIKFTPDSGSVTVRSEPHTDDENFLCLSVRDTGCGIDPKSRDIIFERLAQVKSNTEASRSGLGLGLFIARELISLHGGRIWVDSLLGEGSTFYLTLPIFSLARWCARVIGTPEVEASSVTLVTVDIVTVNGPLHNELLHEIRRALERCIQPGQDVLLPTMSGRESVNHQTETIFIVACTGPVGFAVIERRIKRELQSIINLSRFKPIISSTTISIPPDAPREEQITEVTAEIERLVQDHLSSKERVH
jgi:PAS domain S-box-containing protein